MRDGVLRPADSSSPGLVEVTGKLPSGDACSAWLDPANGHLAARTIITSDDGSTDEIRIDRFTRSAGAYFAEHGIEWQDRGRSGVGRYTVTEATLRHVEVGHVRESIFALPKLTPGSVLKDDRALKFWEIGPNGERIFRGDVLLNGGARDLSQPHGMLSLLGWLLLAGVSAAVTLTVCALSRRGVGKHR